MKTKKLDRYVPLSCIEKLLIELLAPRFLKDAIETLENNSKAIDEVFGEVGCLFEEVEAVFKDRLEVSLARFEALTLFIGISQPPKEISNVSMLKAKTAALQFSKTIGADQEIIDALERVFSQANSDIIEAEASASIKDLAQALEEAIEAVKNSLRKWKEQRKDILTELLESDSEETQCIVEISLTESIDAFLRRLALERIIDSKIKNIDDLPQDIRRFIKMQIIR